MLIGVGQTAVPPPVEGPPTKIVERPGYMECENACWQEHPNQPPAVTCIQVWGVECPPQRYTPGMHSCLNVCREASGLPPLGESWLATEPNWGTIAVLAAAGVALWLVLSGGKG